jgi:two-component system sensor histidine kinase GlrK
MKFTIFSRMVIGYLAIFLLVIAMGVYAFVEISRFNEVTQSVLITNNRVIDYTQKLTDSILSQIRYERKFIITKDAVFFNEFSRLRGDFARYLEEVMSITDSPQVTGVLSSVKDSYQTYQTLLKEEMKYLKDGYSYSQQSYKEEKDRVTDEIMGKLEGLRTYMQQNTTDKIKGLYEAGTTARRMILLMTAAFLILGIAISFFINRSITQPISMMKKKTKEIAKGEFKGDLNLSSPPELAELAGAFNLMCNKLNELDQMKSDFFSSVAHELRNPLATIKMGLGLLREGREGPITATQKELLILIEGEGNRLIGLINSLLDLAKMEAGMMTYHYEQKDLAPLIDQVITEMGPLVDGKKINLESRMLEGLPIVKVDGERILQVLRNIIGNAVKFTPNGGSVKVSARPVDHGVEVSVADTGPGIPADHLTSIFEKFRQATHQGLNQPKGTGLGLAMAKQIVTHHGGKIWAESNPGHGSTFIFVLPA